LELSTDYESVWAAQEFKFMLVIEKLHKDSTAGTSIASAIAATLLGLAESYLKRLWAL
jgi:hypothetical protein